MAMDQYFEEAVPEIGSFEDKPYSGKWKSSSDVIADSDTNASGGFDCNICLERVEDPVVTLCGHLYCWPCIYKWLSSETEEQQKSQCPVCKSEVSRSSLVPLYCHGQTRRASEGKGHQVGTVIPPRPPAPTSYNTTSASHPTSQSYHRHHPHHPYHPHYPQQLNSIPTSYTSPMLSTSSLQDMPFGLFGGMIYSRVFSNQVTDIFTNPNSYDNSWNSNPRFRSHLMEFDKSLSRICYFLLCFLVFCLLMF
ncbi:PREDICTED: E3 ubiquitin-protein ligase RMA1H1-like [Lupinus angustifolius]|uniref:E3 ubiquitin-protein ligase RMA1H1-like n=1 Tax=Lupinus angustifolius TaxID=3871 RepID=UPI00092F1B75|nr:PREDICTED: E3 ubiquitin-protein ligase RMA1H1-like [Lupinus angustifolius]XP_019414115.1 PREDICTED: E3 ubiquitin-protein ligase RMA1H1-like [Lupinus angustifolius]XP_019414116.1 PREDICTED: E3 ubiquitin-protein ligase RMA1H1-like [Lupinus angustifolius]